ncbi:MAG: hypothetical protein PHP46_06250 [Candidatus Omnitrophica bacterium]|nr:hypothetical protein [Candidatus Omnitrophota bacterium]
MIVKKLESDIKDLRSFLEFWEKFHSMYASVVSKEIVTKEDELKFLETKNLISGKYEALKNNLEFNYVPHGRMTDPVDEILVVNNIRLMSEHSLKKMDDDWKDSYVFLNKILERIKDNKRRLEAFNPIGVFFKRIFEKKRTED